MFIVVCDSLHYIVEKIGKKTFHETNLKASYWLKQKNE